MSLMIGALTAADMPQGKGQGKGHGGGGGKSNASEHVSQGKSSGKSHVSKSDDKDDKGSTKGFGAIARTEARNADERKSDNARFFRDLRLSDVRPGVRKFIESTKGPERIAAGAVAFAHARGRSDRDIIVTSEGDIVRVKNRKGDVLLDLDDNKARTLGNWKVNLPDDEIKEGSPSFCRSGAGHPVWGRQWCIDKGFSLGTQQNIVWGRTRDVNDILFLQPVTTTGSLTRDILLNLLGNTAFDRLALHAVTLGLTDPLTGRWLGEPTATGSRVLLVSSGRAPVAEIVDVNRDDHADLMLVALRPW